jgi:hypothetical protein
MFGRNRAQEVTYPELGILKRSHGAWRGQLRLDPFGLMALAIPGSRSAPDFDAVILARGAADEFDRCRPTIDTALTEHREAYVAEPNTDPALAPFYVAVITLDRQLVLEFGYRAPWDEEHTLGARIKDGSLIELSGSVVEP